MPVVEFISFQASEALLADPGLAERTLDIISHAEGYIDSCSGLQVEDGATAYLVIDWESVEHHKTFQASPQYAGVIRGLKPSVAGELEIHYVQFSAEHARAFDAPVTEVIFSKLKEGVPRDEVVALNHALVEGLENTPGVHMPIVWGESKEEPNTFFTVVGWDSIQEAHKRAARGEKIKAVAAELESIVDTTVVHVNFSKSIF